MKTSDCEHIMHACMCISGFIYHCISAHQYHCHSYFFSLFAFSHFPFNRNLIQYMRERERKKRNMNDGKNVYTAIFAFMRTQTFSHDLCAVSLLLCVHNSTFFLFLFLFLSSHSIYSVIFKTSQVAHHPYRLFFLYLSRFRFLACICRSLLAKQIVRREKNIINVPVSYERSNFEVYLCSAGTTIMFHKYFDQYIVAGVKETYQLPLSVAHIDMKYLS